MKKLKRLVWLSFVLIAAGGFWFCLPNPLFDAPVSSIILSQDDRLLGAHIAEDEQWRFPPLDVVPKKFAESIIAFEDKRFYQHIGIDPLAIARAFKLNLQAGRIVSGGSTLSMQVIRLASHNPERSLVTKLTESIMALRLETRYSKQQILALYASYAPFGGNVVGLEVASWRYFGRSPEQLSWAESAMLAVLPNSPGLIHPGRKRDLLKRKRDKLLNKLYQQKKLTALDYELAIDEPLPLKPKPLPRLAPHLLDTLIFTKKLNLANSNQTQLSSRFKTTLNYQLQQNINKIAKHHGEALALAEINNLAILVIDNHNFEVKAYIGNTPTGNKIAKKGQAIDIIQRPRSTGSTLKPFLFSRMLEQGELLPETLVADTPVYYTGYRPKNFDRQFQGAVRAKQALASSLNIPAVNMLSEHGIERFLASLRNMGMQHLYRRSREYGLPLILGGAEGTPWELTSMYANLAKRAGQNASTSQADDHYSQPIIIRGENTDSGELNEISPASAWMTLQALLEVTRPGDEGYWKRFSSTHKIAWKTGTSFGHRDAWAIGTTPQYTVGVWVGNAAGEGRQGMTGVRVAAPILFDVFNRLDINHPWFEKPVEQMKTVSLCKNDGYLANGNCEAIDYMIPISSHFNRVSPHNKKIHLDKVTGQQVHSQCESINNMQHINWFTLPADQAHYYQYQHADFQPLPPWRADCQLTEIGENQENPISLIYPRKNSQIYIPKELNGESGKTLFRALHQANEAKIYWHLDDEFIGATQTFHEQAISAPIGKHRITLVDGSGNRVEQNFSVLSQ